eukprot:NODE_1375_length_1985_cov_43.032760_g1164_i0.p1 GENE.NODE_1375_length_1985_cov_43.032760_g1164_i0~~NODE_1375_length_1985_cov_43.032760_g1164_i0.p1  ORF type:complete len:510 (-),score=72.89 NODE_1375_length_1985_cov_43.032760_g1164_i0:425-1954(-)
MLLLCMHGDTSDGTSICNESALSRNIALSNLRIALPSSPIARQKKKESLDRCNSQSQSPSYGSARSISMSTSNTPRVVYQSNERPMVRSTSPTSLDDFLPGRRPNSSRMGLMTGMIDFPHDHRLEQRYRTMGTLGDNIFEGRNKSTGKQVAIRVINKCNVNSGCLTALKTDIKVWLKAIHTNLVSLIDVYEDESKIYLVMELMLSDTTLERKMDKKPMSESKAQQVFVQLTSVLSYLHSIGIVHSSIRPNNIFYVDQSRIKIDAFSMRKYMPFSTYYVEWTAPESLAVSVQRVTPMASVDMWCLGLILYTMLNGDPPFMVTGDITREQLFDIVKSCRYTLSPEKWDNISTNARDLVWSLLIADPSRRLVPEQILQHCWLDGMSLMESFNGSSLWSSTSIPWLPLSEDEGLVRRPSSPNLSRRSSRYGTLSVSLNEVSNSISNGSPNSTRLTSSSAPNTDRPSSSSIKFPSSNSVPIFSMERPSSGFKPVLAPLSPNPNRRLSLHNTPPS